LDHAEIIRAGQPLPYRDEQFDLVVARSVFEHIEHPEFTAAELLRITKPAGLIGAVTPNKYGYIALAARLVPNNRHVTALAAIQPDRKPRGYLSHLLSFEYTFGAAENLRACG